MNGYKKLYKAFYSVNKVFSIIAIVAVLVVVILTTVDVVLRLISRTSPDINLYVTGMYEITQMLMILMVFLAYGYTELCDAHVGVNILTSKLKPNVRRTLKIVTDAVMFVFCVILVYSCVLQNQAHIMGNLKTSVLFIPYTPFSLAMTIGAILFAISLLLKTVNSVISLAKHDDDWAKELTES